MGKQQPFFGELEDFKDIYQFLMERGAVLIETPDKNIITSLDLLTEIPERVYAAFVPIEENDGLVEIMSKSIEIAYHGAGSIGLEHPVSRVYINPHLSMRLSPTDIQKIETEYRFIKRYMIKQAPAFIKVSGWNYLVMPYALPKVESELQE